MTSSAKRRVSMGRGAAVPLYQQIYSQLREEIISGVRPVGSPLPTEHEIVATHEVSRTTAKLALNKLVEDGLVVRKRKIGTRVIYKCPTQSLVVNVSRALDDTAVDLETRLSLVAIAEEPADELISKLMGLEPGSSILHVDRIRWLDGVPLGFTQAYLPRAVADLLTLVDFESSPLISILVKSGLTVASAEQTIAAVLADADTAAFLQMHPMQPLLRITRCYRDAAGLTLLLTRAFYRADRYQATVELALHVSP